MSEQIRVQRTIRSDAAHLYDLVSDLPRMGEWSPENTGGAWIDGSSGPAVGAHFKGTNQSGRMRWSTNVVVTVAQPGDRFAFDVTLGPFKIANWDYRFEPDGDTTSVVETWTDHRIPVLGAVGSWLIGVRDRPGRNRQNMEATLARLASAVNG